MIGEVQESLRKRLVSAVTEICRNESFYNEEMKIEGTICIISDKNSFVVFQITELISASCSGSVAAFKNSSIDNEKSQKKENQLFHSYKSSLLDFETNKLLNDVNANEKTVENNQNNVDETSLNLSASFSSNPEESFSNDNNFVARLDNNLYKNKNFLENLSLSNTNLLNKNKKFGNFIRKRRRIIYKNKFANQNILNNSDNSSDLTKNKNLQKTNLIRVNNLLDKTNIKQEVPDKDYENAENFSFTNNNNAEEVNKISQQFSKNNEKNNNDTFTEFSNNCYEEIYMRTPHGIYRYLCKLCNSMFKIRNGLFEHLNGHFGRRPHACRQCDARFAHHSSLHNHVRNKHTIQTEEEKQASLRHVCVNCGRRFRYPSELERHKAVHEEFPVNPLSSSSSFPTNISLNLIKSNNSKKLDLPSQDQLQMAPISLSDVSQNFEFQIFDHIANMSAIVDPIIHNNGGALDEGTSLENHAVHTPTNNVTDDDYQKKPYLTNEACNEIDDIVNRDIKCENDVTN